jgi:hypothetical protein
MMDKVQNTRTLPAFVLGIILNAIVFHTIFMALKGGLPIAFMGGFVASTLGVLAISRQNALATTALGFIGAVVGLMVYVVIIRQVFDPFRLGIVVGLATVTCGNIIGNSMPLGRLFSSVIHTRLISVVISAATFSLSFIVMLGIMLRHLSFLVVFTLSFRLFVPAMLYSLAMTYVYEHYSDFLSKRRHGRLTIALIGCLAGFLSVALQTIFIENIVRIHTWMVLAMGGTSGAIATVPNYYLWTQYKNRMPNKEL